MINEKHIKQLTDKISDLRKKEIWILSLSSILKFFLFIGATFILFSVMEGFFRFSTSVRPVFLGFIILLTIGLGGFYFFPLFRIIKGNNNSLSDENLAKKIGNKYPDIRDNLVNSLQLLKEFESNKTIFSPSLIAETINNTGMKFRGYDFDLCLDYEEIKKYFKYFSVFVIGTLAIISINAGSFADSVTRLMNPATEYVIPASFTMSIKPGDVEVIRNDPLSLLTLIDGQDPEKIFLMMKDEDENEFSEYEITGTSPEYKYDIDKVRKSFEYYVIAEEKTGIFTNRKIISPIYNVVMIYPPQIRKMKIHLDHPNYSGLEDVFLEDNVGDVSALTGTMLSMNLTINKRISKGYIEFSDGTKLDISITGTRGEAKFKVEKNVNYKVILEDEKGIKNNFPIEYKINRIIDDYPFIQIISPGEDTDLTKDKEQTLGFRTSDDFGVSRLRLGYKIIDGEAIAKLSNPDDMKNETTENIEFTFINLPFNKSKNGVNEFLFKWNLNNVSLFPDDRILYFAEAYDNDNVTGPKKSRTESFFIRYPSLDELFEDAYNTQEEQQDRLEEVLDESKELTKKLEELSRELKTSQAVDYEQQKMAEDVIKKQEEILDNIDQIKKEMDELVEKFEDNDLLSAQTLDKYKELQELFQELLSDEMMQKMQELQNAMQNSEKMEDVNNSMDEFNSMQEEFTKKLERTMNILKRLQIEQTMDEIVVKSENIKETQDQINNKLNPETQPETQSETQSKDKNDAKTEKDKQAEANKAGDKGKENKEADKSTTEEESLSQADKENLARQEENLSKSIDNLEKTAERLRDKMEEMPDLSTESLSKAIDKMQEKQLGKQMQQMQKNIQQGKSKESSQQGKQISKEMEEIEKDIKDAQKELNKEQKDKIIKGMQKSARDLLKLSKMQEALSEASGDLTANSDKFEATADIQNNIMTGLSKTIGKIIDISEESFFITPELGKDLGNAAESMQSSITNLANRNNGASKKSQEGAMASLNNAVMSLKEAIKSAKESDSGIGFEEFLKRMLEMSGKQGGLNQQALNMNLNGEMSPEQQAGMQRMMQEQRMLQQSMSQLQGEMGGQKNLQNQLENMAKEMADVIRDMQNNNINQETLKIQERILSRMLDAQRSLNRRDFSKKRQAEQAKMYDVADPGSLPTGLGEKINEYDLLLEKALKEGYNKDFEDLIRKYFELLSKKKNKN